jgi:uncharacterized protein with NRDE domain
MEKEVKDLKDVDKETKKHLTDVETNLTEYQEKQRKMKNSKIAKLFKLTEATMESDLKNDNEGEAPDDVLKFEKEDTDLIEARLISFKQLYDFSNLFLNKSYLKKRTKNNEEHIDALEKDLKEMHQWRDELEARYKKRNEDLDAHFLKNEKQFDEFEKRVDAQDDQNNALFDNHANYLTKLDKALHVTNQEIQSM